MLQSWDIYVARRGHVCCKERIHMDKGGAFYTARKCTCAKLRCAHRKGVVVYTARMGCVRSNEEDMYIARRGVA